MKTSKKRTIAVKKPRKAGKPAQDDQHIRDLVECIVRSAYSKQALRVCVLDLRKLSSVADFFVVCSGESTPQLRAIRDAISGDAHAVGEKPWHVEDDSAPRWILMDFVNVVVHIFDPETRLYYDLERLWGDADVRECPVEDYE